jgi:rhamnosyltransferase subunit B
MSRIVLTTWGSLGDLHPYLALAVELKRRGHTPTVVTLRAWERHVRGAGVDFAPAGPDLPDDRDHAREMVRRLLDEDEGPRHLFVDVFGPRMRESYEEVLAAVRAEGGADLLITHQIPMTAPVVAHVTGVPWVSCMLLPMGFLSSYDPPTPPQAPGLRAVAALHPLVARGIFALARLQMRSWVEPVYRLRRELGLPPGGHPLFAGQHSPQLVLALFSRVLAQKQPDYPPQTLVTGFPFYDAADQKPPSPDLLRFLDDGPPPIVFTLGSSAVWIAGDFWKTSIAVAQSLGRRALLLAGERAEALRAAGLPTGVAAFDYAPHSAVMPRASVVVHQGGVGTTGQALRSGRPMLVMPYGQDQPDNARRCVGLGVARAIPRKAYGYDRARRSLEALLTEPAYATRAAEVSALVRGEHGTATACDAIEGVLARGGSRPSGGIREPMAGAAR